MITPADSAPINLGIVGALGRSGSLVVKAALEDSSFQLSAAVVEPGSSALGTLVSPGAQGVRYTDSIDQAQFSLDGVIDFSTPAVSIRTAEKCAELGVPVVVAVTGHSDEQVAVLEKCADRIPLVLAPNTSLGVFVLHRLATLAHQLLGSKYDVEIQEIHHRHKKDAPSGTANSLASSLLKVGDSLKQVVNRNTISRSSSDEIGMSVLRGGEVAGDHTIYFLGADDRIEIHHSVWSRTVFARGALLLLKEVLACSPGKYTPSDLYSMRSP